jgi:iron complex outermembrane receptor protein
MLDGSDLLVKKKGKFMPFVASVRDLRSGLLLGAATAAAMGLSGAAFAQDQSVETVVVTGSRIPQQGLYSSVPVTAVSQQEMKLEGTTSVETLLNNLPSVFADQTSTMSNGATGTATVDLRGLGSVRTLVLVDGTRLMPGDPLSPVPDLNDIPAALVDHVEVLTGGASAVYGSDAEAGVVNFIMRKDFEGIEFDGQYGIDEADNNNQQERSLITPHIGGAGFAYAQEGILDGNTDTGTVIMGTNTANGKGNLTAYIGYKNSEPVLEAARDFSACTTAFTSKAANAKIACGGSSNYDRFYSLNNSAASSAGTLTVPGTVDNFVKGNGTTGAGTFVPYTGATSQKYNYGALNYLERPDTRWTGGFMGHYEVNKELDIYTSFMFTDDDSIAQIAPSGLFLGDGTISGSFDNINCANPLLSPQQNKVLCGDIVGDAFIANAAYAGGGYYGGQANGNCATQFGIAGCQAGQATVEAGRRNIEGGDRQSEFRHISYRAKIGSKGDLGDGWSYDVYAQYGETIFQESVLNYFSIAKTGLADQVVYGGPGGTTPVCVSGGSCVPVDFYSGVGNGSTTGITTAMEKYLAATGLENGSTNEGILSGSLTGDFGEWGGKSPWAKTPVALAIGGEYRDEFLTFTPDSAVSGGDLEGAGGASPAVPKSGYNVTEGFAELQVPIVEGVPGIESLVAKGGYRYSSYNLAGAVSAYEGNIDWQPIDDFRIRANYQRAVRAPNVLELYGPQAVGLFGGNDPCSSPSNPIVQANCNNAPGNAKVTYAQQGSALLSCVAAQCNQLTGGNTAAKPEISDTRSLGIVFTPTFFDGFTATVDYFDINISGALTGGTNANAILSACYGATATAATQAAACPLVNRDPATHSINTQQGYVIDTVMNEGALGTKGFDFEANYAANFDDWGMKGWGSLSVNFVGTLLNQLTTQPFQAIDAKYDCAGLYGYTCGSPDPRWRHKLRLTWTTPWDVDFSVQWRHLSGVHLDSNTNNPILSGACGGSSTSPAPCPDTVDNKIPAYDYFDLSTDWNIREGVDFHAGVNNVLDKNPPLIFAGIAGPSQLGNGNTFPGTYDALGRQIFVGVTIKY